MHEVEVKLSAMHLGGRKRDLYYAILKLVLQENLYFYDNICCILENVPRFLKNVFHITEDRHLVLASRLSVLKHFTLLKPYETRYQFSCEQCRFRSPDF